MNMMMSPVLQLNAQSVTQAKSGLSTKANQFQQIFNQMALGSEKSDAISKLQNLIGKDLTKLFNALETGNLDGLSDKMANQLISQLNELSNLTDGEMLQSIEQTINNLTKEFSMVEDQNQSLQIVGAFILQHLEKLNASDNQNLNMLTKPKTTQHGEQIIAKILNALNLHGKANTQEPSLISPGHKNMQGDFNKLLFGNKQIPKEWSQKWNELLTKVNKGLSEQQINKPINFVSPKIVDSIKQLITRQNIQAETLRFNLPMGNSVNKKAENQTIVSVEQSQLNSHMTRQEQYVIHVSRPNQSTTQSSNQQQMIEQLQKIIQSSRFTQSGGQKQLSIQLKPANLGEMTLKFTQIDGQMAVKISVMTQAAKEMLEGNLQQLRHMFSPNQVVIERQVDQANTDYTHQFTDDEQSQPDDRNQEHKESHSDSNDQQEDKSFKDYLFEEEV